MRGYFYLFIFQNKSKNGETPIEEIVLDGDFIL